MEYRSDGGSRRRSSSHNVKTMTHMTFRRYRAFTLIELLVVIAI
ncbi:MAG: type II secretion system protein, partial [Verrucomicrobia bacterium]|nr:type II secretion system protein [Verrucomicrobiota bacterium]